MVKIEDLSERDIAEIETDSRLVQMTKDIIVEQKGLRVVNQPGVSISIFSEEGDIVIHANPSFKKLYINDSQYFDLAHQIASAYEAETGKEFTLKKRYSETVLTPNI